MITAVVLLILSLVMIYLEFYLPGGIMGTAGALLAIASIVFFAQTSDSLAGTTLFFLAAVVGVIMTCRLAMHRIQKSGDSSHIYLNTDQEGYRAPAFDESLIGQRGKTVSVMGPSGHIVINGQRHQAVSKFGYIEKDVEVEVIGGQGGHLVVRKSSSKE